MLRLLGKPECHAGSLGQSTGPAAIPLGSGQEQAKVSALLASAQSQDCLMKLSRLLVSMQRRESGLPRARHSGWALNQAFSWKQVSLYNNKVPQPFQHPSHLCRRLGRPSAAASVSHLEK